MNLLKLKLHCKKKILGNSYLGSIYTFLNSYCDEEFRRNVISLRYGYDVLCIHKYGNDNIGKIFYHIYLNDENMGFCALLLSSLMHIMFAEERGMIPVIEYGKDTLYVDTSDNIFDNPFEYFFVQPYVSLESVYTSANVIKASRYHREEFIQQYGWYNPSDSAILMYAKIIDEKIHLKSNLEQIIESKIKNILKGEKVLGVHIRGTDYCMECFEHPKYVSVEEYYEAIDEILTRIDYKRIFLATDDIEILNKMKKKYGEKLIYFTDNLRTNGEKGLHYSVDFTGRRLGEEVLTDILCLAKCDSLVGGLSLVCTFAQIYKKVFKEDFANIKIVQNGISSNAKRFRV